MPFTEAKSYPYFHGGLMTPLARKPLCFSCKNLRNVRKLSIAFLKAVLPLLFSEQTMRCQYLVAALFASSFSAFAEPPKAVDPHLKVTSTFEPAKARPGETVTLKIKLEFDAAWHTYATVQPEKAAKSFTNKFEFPYPGALIFVDDLVEPEKPGSKAEPALKIKAMHIYPSGQTWERKVVVSPTAKAGKLETVVKLKLTICDADHCVPRPTEAKASIEIDGEAVPVESMYRAIFDKSGK